MKVNSVSFGMKFSPRAEVFITKAEDDCKTIRQKLEFQKCVDFLEKTFPEKTLDIKTEFYKPKNFMERLLGKKGYYDEAYIDDKFVLSSKIQTINEEQIENERLTMVGGLLLPTYDLSVISRKENTLERLIALTNGILVHYYADSSRFPFVSNKKFMGGN